MDSGSAAQLTTTKGPLARSESSWMARATSSLPVPDSPRTSTVAVDGAACCTISIMATMAGEPPMMGRARVRPISASSRLSITFSALRAWRSSARSTVRMTSADLNGFWMKSYAPSRMAETATSTVPYAVITITSTEGRIARAARSRSWPLIPGSMRSVRMRSMANCRTSSSASSPLTAVCTVRPSRSKMRRSEWPCSTSSSTMSRVPRLASGEGVSASVTGGA
jgi:hypothetical protein